MLRVNEDKQLYALACELMETEGFDEVTAVREAQALLESLHRFAAQWDNQANQAQRCGERGQHEQQH